MQCVSVDDDLVCDGMYYIGTRKLPAFKLAKVTVNAKLMLQALDDLEPLCVWMNDSAEDHSRSVSQLITNTNSSRVLPAVVQDDLVG